jgi:hypothetical protein
MLGEQRLQGHLEYEISKYAGEGLRPDYQQELALFDPHDVDDPDRRLRRSRK